MFRLILTDTLKKGKRQLTDFTGISEIFFGIVPKREESLQFAGRCFIIVHRNTDFHSVENIIKYLE